MGLTVWHASQREEMRLGERYVAVEKAENNP